MADTSALNGATVLLTGPDGQEHTFCLGQVIPLKDEEYVLLHGTGVYEGQMLITIVRAQEDGSLGFEMVEDERILEDVLGAYVASSIQETIANAPEDEVDHPAGEDPFFTGN